MHTFASKFGPGDLVRVSPTDGADSIDGKIVSVQFDDLGRVFYSVNEFEDAAGISHIYQEVKDSEITHTFKAVPVDQGS